MRRIEVEWLCMNAHLHSNYPFMPDNAGVDEFAKEWLKGVVCECGAFSYSYKVFQKGEIEMPRCT